MDGKIEITKDQAIDRRMIDPKKAAELKALREKADALSREVLSDTYQFVDEFLHKASSLGDREYKEFVEYLLANERVFKTLQDLVAVDVEWADPYRDTAPVTLKVSFKGVSGYLYNDDMP